jgi:uncharacterized Zn-finger protein
MFSQLDHLHLTGIRIHHHHHNHHNHHHTGDLLTLSASDSFPPTTSPSHVYNLWQNSPDFSPSSPSLASDPIRRSFHNLTYQPFQDDRISNSRLLPMLPYTSRTTQQHIPGTNNSAAVDDRSSPRSLTGSFSPPIYSSPSYTLSAAIPSASALTSPFSISSPSARSPALPPPPPPPPPPQPSPLPPPPPSSSCSPHTSPSPSPPSSPDRKSPHPPPPSLPSVQAFRLDTLQSVDPSDDPCPLSLNDLMIPSEEQEYQGHSYHFSLQSVSPPKPKPQALLDEKPSHEETNFPKRKGKSKMHTCALCQKSFPRPSGLRTHMNSHSGDKRWSCLSFFYSDLLTLVRLAYKCPVASCAKSFTVRSNAKRHIRTHGMHLQSPQAADAAALNGGDFSLVPTDKDSQRTLRIRWVGQNSEEHPEDRVIGQPSNLHGSTCGVGDVRSNSDVDDDDSRTSRTEDVRCLVDQLKVSGTLRTGFVRLSTYSVL